MSSDRTRNPFELHDNRLATTDEYGNRIYLYPEDVKGKWKSRRNIVYGILIFLFMILPWLHYKGMQIILLNIPQREFIFFGYIFYGHDAPFIIFFLFGFLVLIGLLTAMWGRVWCGWACPQTVFIQAIYGTIERLVEGKARARRRRDQGPITLNKFFLKGVKWLLFLLVSLHLSHSFLGYFVGTRELLHISAQSPTENLTLFGVMWFFTLLFLFDFGWFREQFCIIACPYGRFQSVMMDESSKVVAYDEKRGEPRRGGALKDEEGDCINCYHCVSVCPTGIDIRRGSSQLECIACTQCIDACDAMMVRLGRAPGLIRYSSENERAGKKSSVLRLRIVLYGAALIAITLAFIFSLGKRFEMDIEFIRAVGAPYTVQEQTGEVTNRFVVNINHHEDEPAFLIFEVDESLRDSVSLIIQRSPYPVQKGRNSVSVFLRFPKGVLQDGSLKLPVTIYHKPDMGELFLIETREVNLVGPF